MLDYAAKLTSTPGEMVPEDLDPLRANGISDSAIGDIALSVSLFSVMNRMVDGLGGDVPAEFVEEARGMGMVVPDHMVEG
jgi:hypothetical protein